MKASRISIILSVVFTVLLTVLPLAAEDNDTDVHISATVYVTGGMDAGETGNIDIYIDRFSSDEETSTLVGILKEKGMIALQQAMRKIDVGRISLDGGASTRIAIATSEQMGDTRIIRLYIDRNVGFLERVEMTRSSDYPFSMIQLQLNEKGEGQGAGIPAAKIDFNSLGQLVIESFGHGMQVVNLVNVMRFD